MKPVLRVQRFLEENADIAGGFKIESKASARDHYDALGRKEYRRVVLGKYFR
ncbi:MAG: hypothetical protein KUG70_14360 [Rhodobacteraceae bacterium]|nr:hypothetical protein [Paracoccaceae bacterium]